MITDTGRTLLLEIVGPRCTAGIVHDHGRLAALHNMYTHRVSAAEREDLRLAAPCARIADGRAVSRILARANNARLKTTDTVLALDGRQERRKVLRVGKHVCGSRAARIGVVRFVWRDEVEERQLVCDGGEQTMTVRNDLQYFVELEPTSEVEGDGCVGARTSCISRLSSLHILLIARSSSLASRSSLASATGSLGGCSSASAASLLALWISLLPPAQNGRDGTSAPVLL
jgi:hypothetical protein